MKEVTLESNQMIYERYLVKEKSTRGQDAIIRSLAAKFKIGEFYVRNILKQYGVEIARKESYDRKDKGAMLDRNSGMINMYNDGKNPDEIAFAFGISAARVRQILKATLGKDFKKAKVVSALAAIKDDVASGMSHIDILQKYGKEVLRKVKVNFKYNVFKATRKNRDNEILRRYRSREIEQIQLDASVVEKFRGMNDTEKKEKRNAGEYPVAYKIVKTWPSANDISIAGIKRSDIDEISQKEAGHNILSGFEWRAVRTPQNIADSMRLTRDYIYSIVNSKRRNRRK